MRVAHCPECQNRMEPIPLYGSRYNPRMKRNIRPSANAQTTSYRCMVCMKRWSLNGDMFSERGTIQKD